MATAPSASASCASSDDPRARDAVRLMMATVLSASASSRVSDDPRARAPRASVRLMTAVLHNEAHVPEILAGISREAFLEGLRGARAMAHDYVLGRSIRRALLAARRWDLWAAHRELLSRMCDRHDRISVLLSDFRREGMCEDALRLLELGEGTRENLWLHLGAVRRTMAREPWDEGAERARLVSMLLAWPVAFLLRDADGDGHIRARITAFY